MTNSNGLDVSFDQFKKLPQKEQHEIFYRKLVDVEKKLDSYHFHRKIQYVWLSVLTGVVLTIAGLKSVI